MKTLVMLTVTIAAWPAMADEPRAISPPTQAEAWAAGWPSYRGPRGDYSALDTGAGILADPSRARLLWKSEAYDMPRGKAWSSTDGSSGAAGHPGGGGCSPVVAFGCVYQFYTRPAGDVYYDVPRGRKYSKALFRVEADDVAHCVDLATGKTRWVRTFVRRSINGQSMKSCIPDNNTPCIVGDTFVFLGPSWRLYGIDARSGEWRWERPATDRCAQAELLKLNSLLRRTRTIAGHNMGLGYLLPVGNDLVLLNDQSGGIHAINAADGTTRWQAGGGRGALRVSNWHLPAIWRHGDKDLLLLSTTTGILCLDPIDGSTRWGIDEVTPQGHLTVIGDRLVALGGKKRLNAESNPLGHRGGALGHPVCWHLTGNGARQLWQRDNLVTDGSKWAYRLDGRRVAVLHWAQEREGRVKRTTAVELRVLDLATGKDLAKPVSAMDLFASNATRNGYGIATDGVVIFESDISHAYHDFFSIFPLATIASFSGVWKPPHPTTTAYDSYMAKPMIAGRRVMRGALGLLCYDWRERPVDDGLFVGPDIPDWARKLPKDLQGLAHPFRTVRDRAASEAPWRADYLPAGEVLLARADRGSCEALAAGICRWGKDAAKLAEPVTARVKVLVEAGRGDSAAFLARALRHLDARTARTLLRQLAPELAAKEPRRARAACEVIGRLGPGLGKAGVAVLATTMQRKDVVAQCAARALVRASATDAASVDALIQGIGSSDVLLSVASSQSLRAMVVLHSGDAELLGRIADRLPTKPPDARSEANSPTAAGFIRVAEQLGTRGRNYLIPLAEAGSQLALHALVRGFGSDGRAMACAKEIVNGEQDAKRRARLLSILKGSLGGDLPELRTLEARRY